MWKKDRRRPVLEFRIDLVEKAEQLGLIGVNASYSHLSLRIPASTFVEPDIVLGLTVDHHVQLLEHGQKEFKRKGWKFTGNIDFAIHL